MSQTNLVKNPLPTELGSVILCGIDGKTYIGIAWTHSDKPDWKILGMDTILESVRLAYIIEWWTPVTAEKVKKWRGAHKRIKALRKIMRVPFPKNDFYTNGVPSQYDALADLYDQKLADQLREQIEP